MRSLFESLSISDAIQIAILYAAIYAILKRAHGSRFGQVLTGIGVLVTVAAAFTFVFHFTVLARIVQLLLIYLAMSTVVIFQPEIRRILSAVGAFGFLNRATHSAGGRATPEYVADTLIALAGARMGALVAFERGISLRGYEEDGVTLDAVFTRQLVKTVFTPPLPLHDGGVVVRDGRLSSAHCIFPVSNNPGLDSHGMRHRAAVGLSEETDAIVFVVSEETGDISIAHNGRLVRCAGDQRESALARWVAKAMQERRKRKPWMFSVFSRPR